MTLTLTFDPAIPHTVVHHSSTCTYIPNFIQIEETFCGRTDVRTGGRTFLPSILLGRLSEVDLIKDCARGIVCSVEANYWQIWSIVQPLCDSRATCSIMKKQCYKQSHKHRNKHRYKHHYKQSYKHMLPETTVGDKGTNSASACNILYILKPSVHHSRLSEHQVYYVLSCPNILPCWSDIRMGFWAIPGPLGAGLTHT